MERPVMMEYKEKQALVERFKGESNPARKNGLKLVLVLEMVKELERCFSNYDDQGERWRFKMLIPFLQGETDELEFSGHFPYYRYKGDWCS